GKSGLTHFHVGEEDDRLQPLRAIIEDYDVSPEWLYPTHIQRNDDLLAEAIALGHEGARLDMDCVEEDTEHWVAKYMNAGGPLDKLSVSSDMDSNSPDVFFRMFCELVVKKTLPLPVALRLFSSNAAIALKRE